MVTRNSPVDNERIPLQNQSGQGSNVSLKIEENIFEVRQTLVTARKDQIDVRLQERDHRPRTVLDQLYNYKGGIVPHAAEADKSAGARQVLACDHCHRKRTCPL